MGCRGLGRYPYYDSVGFSSYFFSLLSLLLLINCNSHWIYPKTYVVDDSIELHKLLLDSQLSSNKTYDCRVLIVKRASDQDVKIIRSILEKPTCRMRGLRNLAHISFGKVTVYSLLFFSGETNEYLSFYRSKHCAIFHTYPFFSHALIISMLAPLSIVGLYRSKLAVDGESCLVLYISHREYKLCKVIST